MITGIAFLATLMSQTTLEEPVILTAPVPQVSKSNHIAVVQFDCLVVDESHNTHRLMMLKSGRMLVAGEYDDRNASDPNPEIPEPVFEVLPESDPIFSTMVTLEPGERNFIGPTSVLALDGNGDFAAIFSMSRGHPNSLRSSGRPLDLYMPRADNPEKPETMSGVCIPQRLEDKTS